MKTLVLVLVSSVFSFWRICSAVQWWLCWTLEFRRMSQCCFRASRDRLFICSEMSSSYWECQELRSVYSSGPCTFDRVALQLLWLDQKHKDFFLCPMLSYSGLSSLGNSLKWGVSCRAGGKGLTFLALSTYSLVSCWEYSEKEVRNQSRKNYVQL